jgi:hypothetical protein
MSKVIVIRPLRGNYNSDDGKPMDLFDEILELFNSAGIKARVRELDMSPADLRVFRKWQGNAVKLIQRKGKA